MAIVAFIMGFFLVSVFVILSVFDYQEQERQRYNYTYKKEIRNKKPTISFVDNLFSDSIINELEERTEKIGLKALPESDFSRHIVIKKSIRDAAGKSSLDSDKSKDRYKFYHNSYDKKDNIQSTKYSTSSFSRNENNVKNKNTVNISRKETKSNSVSKEHIVTYKELKQSFSDVVQKYINAVTFTGEQSDYIFTAPSIFDNSIPATGRFVDNMYETQKYIESKMHDVNPNREADNKSIEMVEKTKQSWIDAIDFARSNVSLAIPPKKHSTVRGLINKVLLSTVDDRESEIARDRIVSILQDIEYKVPVIGAKKDSVMFIDKKLNHAGINTTFIEARSLKENKVLALT